MGLFKEADQPNRNIRMISGMAFKETLQVVITNLQELVIWIFTEHYLFRRN